MTYQGYMALANEDGETIELVNASRVKAYTDNLAPSIGLRGCDDCEGLDAALGDTYVDPVTDNAPWYDPTDPATADFYGVYPLAFEGIDDSTRTIESAELTGDGSVVVGSRFTGKDIRVSGMAFAKDEAALYAGVSWMDSALNGTEEGRCFGDRLDLYSSCPPIQVLPPDFATPYSLVNPPSAAELAAWTTTSGTITGPATGVRFDWVAGDPRKIACREITGLIPGEQYQLRLRLEVFGDYFVSLGPACVERGYNLVSDPRLTTRTMTLQGATVIDSRPTTDGPDGGTFFRREIQVANTTSPMAMAMSSTGVNAIEVTDGLPVTFSWYARKAPGGGPSTRLDWTWYDGAGATISTVTGTPGTANATWTRNTQTSTPPAGASYGQPRLAWSGTALVGQTLDLAQAMLNVGTSALDYFDGGYPNARWDGVANASTSTYEENVDYETIFGWTTTHTPPTSPTVLDFIPRTTSLFLSIQPTDSEPLVPTIDLEVQDALVHRVARPGVVAFGTGDDAVPPSDGWTHLAPATMQVTWILGSQVQGRSVRTDARAPSGSALTYTTAHGPQRTLYGLRPGSRYRLMIEFDAFYSVTDVSASLSLVPNVVIGNSINPVVTYTDDNPGTFQYFWVVEFTATATSSNLAFHPGSNLSLGSFGLVIWQFSEYMVEEILATDTAPPQPGRLQERVMYEVKASQGPILTDVRSSPCGVMGRISYSLRAGNPFKYRSPIFAGGLPAGTSATVPDILCSEDGLAQIVNYAYNPSVELNATDWAAGGLNATGVRVASATARVGGFIFRASAPNSPGNLLSNATAYYNAATVVAGPEPQPGETITTSIYFRTTGAVNAGTYDWTIFVTMVGFPSFSFTGSEVITTGDITAGTWRRIQATFTLPDNISLSVIETAIEPPSGLTQGGLIETDGLMIQTGPVATEPFDETFPNVEWAAAPNVSALILSPVLEDISEDPDCPTPPAPPAPPTIDDACIIAPNSYNRTVVAISADTVPRNLTAYPVITLTAGAADVRQARIRFWENPDSLTIDDLDPCSFDGEIVVSYLASGATMVIDGVLHEATISKPGFPTVNGNHLLYGPDGGPVDWPELSGGIPYLVTLELDSTAPYTDTLMTVDLVVKD